MIDIAFAVFLGIVFVHALVTGRMGSLHRDRSPAIYWLVIALLGTGACAGAVIFAERHF